MREIQRTNTSKLIVINQPAEWLAVLQHLALERVLARTDLVAAQCWDINISNSF